MTGPDPARRDPAPPDPGPRDPGSPEPGPANSGPADPAPPGPARPDARGRPDPFLPHRRGWLERRRDKIAEEIARNRRGEYTVPTWVLAVILVAFVAGWIALVTLA